MIDFDEYTRVYKNLDLCLLAFEEIMQQAQINHNIEIAFIIEKCMDKIQENNNNAKRARNN